MTAALAEAVESATRGALAMGLSPHIRLSRAVILDDVLVIQLLAADGEAPDLGSEAPASPDAGAPDESPGDSGDEWGAPADQPRIHL